MNAHQRRKQLRKEAKAKKLFPHQIKALRHLKGLDSKVEMAVTTGWHPASAEQALSRLHRQKKPPVIIEPYSGLGKAQTLRETYNTTWPGKMNHLNDDHIT